MPLPQLPPLWQAATEAATNTNETTPKGTIRFAIIQSRKRQAHTVRLTSRPQTNQEISTPRARFQRQPADLARPRSWLKKSPFQVACQPRRSLPSSAHLTIFHEV